VGNINPTLYRLAVSAPDAFHDITVGNNIVPCVQGTPDCASGQLGYNAGVGYDLATGLGSVDANLLVNHWTDASAVNFLLTATPSSVTVAVGKSATASLALTRQGGFTSAVALSSSGAPSGVTVTLSPTSITTAPATVTIAATSSAPAGSYTLTLTGTNTCANTLAGIMAGADYASTTINGLGESCGNAATEGAAG